MLLIDADATTTVTFGLRKFPKFKLVLQGFPNVTVYILVRYLDKSFLRASREKISLSFIHSVGVRYSEVEILLVIPNLLFHPMVLWSLQT